MSRGARVQADALAILLLIAWHLLYFLPVTLGQSVWGTGDVIQEYIPFGTELRQALLQGRLPLWTTGIQTGFPALAQGLSGPLYPLNWLFFRILPAYFAVSYSMLFHLVWAAIGMYACMRANNQSPSSAFLAGFVFSFNGFTLQHLLHQAILATFSWLPWIILFQTQFQLARFRNERRARVWLALEAAAIGLMFFSGSVQLAFFNSLAVVSIGLAGMLLWNRDPNLNLRDVGAIARGVFWVAVPLVLGVGLAAIQLIPTTEMVSYSARSGALSFDFLSGYSLPPEYLLKLITPYFQGEPIELTAEFWGYFGLVPLMLALLAPFLRRDSRTIFYFIFALLALSLALGDLNPIYPLVSRLPIFSLFRVPARYLSLFLFAAIFLAASAFDDLARRLESDRGAPAILLLLIPALISIYLAYTRPLQFWLDLWQFFPVVLFFTGIVLLVLARTHRISRGTWRGVTLGLVIFDLAVFAPPFFSNVATLVPPSTFETLPRSIAALQWNPMDRVFTDRTQRPSDPALRASLWPNTALLYGKASVQVYGSLALAHNDAFAASASPTMLNLLGARYLFVPLEPRAQDKSLVPPDPLSLDVVNNEAVFPSRTVNAIEIDSFTEDAATLTDGTTIAQIELRSSNGGIDIFPLRIGIETADWDYERKSATQSIQHHRAEIAASFPAFWRSFGKNFEGHLYRSRYEIGSREIIGINVRSLQPSARLTVPAVFLYDDRGAAIALAKLTGKDEFVPRYLSDTVAVWENLDVMPRAFVVHVAQIADDAKALDRMSSEDFDSARIALLNEGEAISDSDSQPPRDSVRVILDHAERVEIAVETDRKGYLVLADSWYPGWQAYVDDKPTPIDRADLIFRAVPLEPGAHRVVFEYQPLSFRLGALLSLVSVAILAGLFFAIK